jgi:hypothetical protein
MTDRWNDKQESDGVHGLALVDGLGERLVD